MNRSSYRPGSLQACHSIADLRSLAQRKLPKVMFDYVDGAAEDEVSMARNSSDFGRYSNQCPQSWQLCCTYLRALLYQVPRRFV